MTFTGSCNVIRIAESGKQSCVKETKKFIEHMPLHKEIKYGVVSLPHPKKKPSQLTEQYQEETIHNIFNETHVSP